MKTCKRSEIPPGFRVYQFIDGREYAARNRSCFFCRNCIGILYDSGGPYAFICELELDTDLGIKGMCNEFTEVEDNES